MPRPGETTALCPFWESLGNHGTGPLGLVWSCSSPETNTQVHPWLSFPVYSPQRQCCTVTSTNGQLWGWAILASTRTLYGCARSSCKFEGDRFLSHRWTSFLSDRSHTGGSAEGQSAYVLGSSLTFQGQALASQCAAGEEEEPPSSKLKCPQYRLLNIIPSQPPVSVLPPFLPSLCASSSPRALWLFPKGTFHWR